MMIHLTAPLLTRPRFLHGPAGIWDQEVFWRWSMTGFVPVMWSVWGVLVLLLIALNLYKSRLTRDEDDQIILDESLDRLKTEQDAMVEKVNKMQPLVRVAMGLAAAATLVVIVYCGMDIYNQFK